MKSAQCILALLCFLLSSIIPPVESQSYIAWDGEGNWDGISNWSQIPEGIFVGPGVGNVQGADFCDVVRNKSQPLQEALLGRNLSIATQYGPGFDFFEYDPNAPLSDSNPSGMIANVLDELAKRAGFSWRNSFVAYNTTTADLLVGTGSGKWDRMLKETTSFFDLSVDKWLLTTERLENETVFLHSWFDATLILVDQGDKAEINWLSFAAPFEGRVWFAIAGTVLMSAVFMVIIESEEGRRDGRSMHSWFSDHLYLTTLAFSQQFVFINPISGAGRVFLSSFAFWATLIGATYTANLASLLVENALASPVKSIEGAMDNKMSICIHEGSASQTIMESFYPGFRGYPKLVKARTTHEMYDLLTAGSCEILIGTQQEYEIFRREEQHGCNLVQAGGELHAGSASFAIEFDPLNCDSVLAYVLNIHLNEMSVDGNMTNFWENYLDNRGGNCEVSSGRRMTEIDETNDDEDGPPSYSSRRELKGTTAAASSANGFAEDSTDESLKITGMAGVFAVHAVGTGIAILIAIYAHLRKWYKAEQARQKSVFGVDSKMVENNQFEEAYDSLKEDMMAQMDRFFEEHRESGFQRESSVQMRSIIDARKSITMGVGVPHRSSVMASPGTPGNPRASLDLSTRSGSSPPFSGAPRRARSPKRSRSPKPSLSPRRNQNNTALEELRLDPLDESTTLSSTEEEGKSHSFRGGTGNVRVSKTGLSGAWYG